MSKPSYLPSNSSLPAGEFAGRALGWWRPFNLFWKGKVFTGVTVKNKILGHLWIQGDVFADGPTRAIIVYRFGLVDRLTLDGEGYRGSMKLGPVTVRFVLTRE